VISIYMTERASRKVRTLLASGPGTADFGLRIGVDPGGCWGYQYRLVLAPRADPDEVRADVRRVKRLLGPNLIVSPSHEAILPNVPVENVAALVEAAHEQEDGS